MRELLESTAQRAITYLEGLDTRAVAPDAAAVTNLAVLDEPLPQSSTPEADVLRQLDELCSPATMAMAGPRFFGFIIGGAQAGPLAANWLGGAGDRDSGLCRGSAGAAVSSTRTPPLSSARARPSGKNGPAATARTPRRCASASSCLPNGCRFTASAPNSSAGVCTQARGQAWRARAASSADTSRCRRPPGSASRQNGSVAAKLQA